MKIFFLSSPNFGQKKRTDSVWRNFSFGHHYSQISWPPPPPPFENPAYASVYCCSFCFIFLRKNPKKLSWNRRTTWIQVKTKKKVFFAIEPGFFPWRPKRDFGCSARTAKITSFFLTFCHFFLSFSVNYSHFSFFLLWMVGRTACYNYFIILCIFSCRFEEVYLL